MRDTPSLSSVDLYETDLTRIMCIRDRAGTALTADRVDLVDEDDRRRLLLGVLEELSLIHI